MIKKVLISSGVLLSVSSFCFWKIDGKCRLNNSILDVIDFDLLQESTILELWCIYSWSRR